MSLIHIANACSHLQNASAARLGLTSLPSTKMLHTLLLSLQNSGYVSSVTIGGPEPPVPSALSPILDPFHHISSPPPPTPPPSSPPSSSSSSSSSSPLSSSSISTTTTKTNPPHFSTINPPITQSNVASRRLWIGMKYYRNEPVLRKMRCVSKPTRRVWMGVESLEALARGDQQGYVRGLRGVGEAMFVTTDRGIMEIRECVDRRIGGMLLCRVNPVF